MVSQFFSAPRLVHKIENKTALWSLDQFRLQLRAVRQPRNLEPAPRKFNLVQDGKAMPNSANSRLGLEAMAERLACILRMCAVTRMIF